MYIEKIKSPADLKKLDLKELQVVADETRQAVLNRVSKHGGHEGQREFFSCKAFKAGTGLCNES